MIKNKFINKITMTNERNRTEEKQEEVKFRSGVKIFQIHKQQRKKFKCHKCERAFNQKSNLNTHMRIHTGEKPFRCPFEECRKQFTTSGNLKSHMSIHTGQKSFTCSFNGCCKKYYLAYRLKIHMRIHKNEKPYKCDKCEKQFNEKGNLRIHERIHSGERPYKCNYLNCEARFKTQGHMKDHFTRHYDQKPFKCDECGSCFKKLSDLNKHLSDHINLEENQNGLAESLKNLEGIPEAEMNIIPDPLKAEDNINGQVQISDSDLGPTPIIEEILPEQDQIINFRKSSLNNFHLPSFNPKFQSGILPQYNQENSLFPPDDFNHNHKLFHLPSYTNRYSDDVDQNNHLGSANNIDHLSNNLFFSYGIN